MCKREESLPTEIKRAWEDGVPIQNLGDIANTLSRVMTSLKKWSVENFKAVTKMTFGSGVWWNGATSFHFMRVWLENVRPERFQKREYSMKIWNEPAPEKPSNHLAPVSLPSPPQLELLAPTLLCPCLSLTPPLLRPERQPCSLPALPLLR
jgi:hypothetical protein